MSNKNVFVVGFMLFAMFFGAGNLIFPPGLGFVSGEHFWLAILGFVITGVGLPLLGVIVGSISKEGYKESLKAIHPAFAIGLLVVIYLTIGPFFAIPRTATTAYEMSLIPFLDSPSTIALLVFSLIFFIIVFALSWSPGTLADSIGKVLISNPVNPVGESFNADAPFAAGFQEGYLTMDAIAAIAFSVIVLNAIRATGVKDRKSLLFGTIKSASLAALLLGLVYVSLGWLGNKVDLGSSIPDEQNLGTFLLTFISSDAYGGFGAILLGVIVLLACITTGAGLIVAVSEYFNSIVPKIPYRAFVVIFTLISFGLANQGLDQVITTSVPVLSIIYPVAMASVLLLIFSYFVPSPRLALQIPIVIIIITSVLAVVHRNEWANFSFLEAMPLFETSFEWIPLLIIGYIVGYLIGMKKEKVSYT